MTPTTPPAVSELTESEFCRRFVDHMVKFVGRETLDDGTSVREYATETAPSYFEDQHQDGESPEDCAETDVSYWED